MNIIYKVVSVYTAEESKGKMFSSFPSQYSVEYAPGMITTPPIEGSLLYAFISQKFAEEYIAYIERCLTDGLKTLHLWSARGNIMAMSAPGALWERDFLSFWDEKWYGNDLYNYTKVTTGFDGAVWCNWIELVSQIGG